MFMMDEYFMLCCLNTVMLCWLNTFIFMLAEYFHVYVV